MAKRERERERGVFRHVTSAHFAAASVLAKHPALAIREAHAVGKYNAADDISNVVAMGIPVHIVVSDTDEMFDKEKLSASHQDISVRASSYSRISEDYPGHDTFWMHPQATASLVKAVVTEH